jgi:hypothetical protein
LKSPTSYRLQVFGHHRCWFNQVDGLVQGRIGTGLVLMLGIRRGVED